jgi:ferric-dicitrate binding protein FerR (iron transport regulator)
MTIARTFVLRTESNAAALHSFLKANAKAMADAGKPLEVSISEAGAKRNVQQNRRNWALVSYIAEHAWVEGRQYSKETWHEYFARKFGVMKELVLPDGEITLQRESTAEMDVEAFNSYLLRIEAYAAQELGIEFI